MASGAAGPRRAGSPEIVFRFTPPDADIEVHLGCRWELVCDLMQVRHPTPRRAPPLGGAAHPLGGIRAYILDHYAMAAPVAPTEGAERASNGHNLAAVLAVMQAERPDLYPARSGIAARPARLCRDGNRAVGEGSVELGLRLIDDGELVAAENASQGALNALAILALSSPPARLRSCAWRRPTAASTRACCAKCAMRFTA